MNKHVLFLFLTLISYFYSCTECKYDTECPLPKVCQNDKCVLPSEIIIPDASVSDTVADISVDTNSDGAAPTICDLLGYQWVTEQVDNLYPTGDDGSIAVDSNGVVHMAYHYFGSDVTQNDADSQLRYANNMGGNWNLYSLDQWMAGKYTSLHLDSNGNIHMAYRKWGQSPQDVANGFTDLTAALYIDNVGGQWNQFQIIDTEGDVGRHTWMQLDSNGYSHVAYFFVTDDRDPTAPNFPIDIGNVKYANNTSGSWEVETVDLGDYQGDFVGERIFLLLDSSDRPHIFYYNYGKCDATDDECQNHGGPCRDACYTEEYLNLCDENACTNDLTPTLRHAWKDEQNQWQIEDIAQDAGINDYFDFGTITGAIDSNGAFHIFYNNITYDFPDAVAEPPVGGVMYAHNESGTWVVEPFIADAKYPSFVIDERGKFHLIYQDISEGGRLMYATNATPTSEWMHFVAFENDRTAGYWAALTIDQNSSLHAVFVAYTDANDTFGFAHYSHTVSCNE